MCLKTNFEYVVCRNFFLLSGLSVKISFWNWFVLFVSLSVKSPKFVPIWSLSYFQPISVTIFVTRATDLIYHLEEI